VLQDPVAFHVDGPGQNGGIVVTEDGAVSHAVHSADDLGTGEVANRIAEKPDFLGPTRAQHLDAPVEPLEVSVRVGQKAVNHGRIPA
jgi:hypothetical protein